MDKVRYICHKIDYIAAFFFVIACICLIALFLITFADIMARFLANSNVPGTIELGQYFLVAMAFLAFGFTQLKGGHIQVQLFLHRLPTKAANMMNILVLILSMAFFIIMLMQVGERFKLSFISGELLSVTTFRLPVWWSYALGTFGCAVLILCFITQIVTNIVGIIENKEVGLSTWNQ